MASILRITTNAPIRYAKWPAQPTRKVGARLLPGEVLVIPARDERYWRFVAEGDSAQVELTKTQVAVP